MAEVAQHHTGSAPGYRIRDKVCARCDQTFDTVELPQQVFAAFLREFQNHRTAHLRLLDAVSDLKRRVDASLFPEDAKIYAQLLRMRAKLPKKA